MKVNLNLQNTTPTKSIHKSGIKTSIFERTKLDGRENEDFFNKRLNFNDLLEGEVMPLAEKAERNPVTPKKSKVKSPKQVLFSRLPTNMVDTELMEIEEQISNNMSPNNNISGNSPCLFPSEMSKNDSCFPIPAHKDKIKAMKNKNVLSRWRNNDLIFWGKYSTGATPKINKTRDHLQSSNEAQTTASTVKNKKQAKRPRKSSDRNLETKLFTELLENQGNENTQSPTDRFEVPSSFKEPMSPELLSPKSPVGNGRSYKEYINNSMSIKKERKMFDRYVDLNDDEATTDYMEEEYHGKHKSVFYTGKKEDAKRRNSSPTASRFSTDYEILEVIGNGCFGSVYKCRNKFDGNIYAIKSTKNKILGEKSKNQALNEAIALASLSVNEESENIVRYYNAWVEDCHLYIVMEYCAGSLNKLRQTKKVFTEFEIRKILRDICLGLKHIHYMNIVHLDIKPENILYSHQDKYKLADLGMSRIANRSCPQDIDEGDSRYVAPELLNLVSNSEQIPDLTKADIFSLAASMYELLIGEPLPSNGEEWHRIRRGDLSRLDRVNCSRNLKHELEAMMSPNPRDRPSARELLTHHLFQSELERELKWERMQNMVLRRKLNECQIKLLQYEKQSIRKSSL